MTILDSAEQLETHALFTDDYARDAGSQGGPTA